MSGRTKPVPATCPDCGSQRTVWMTVGPTIIAAGITRRCKPCANRRIARNRFKDRAGIRVCPDCGDKQVMPLKSLRTNGVRPAPGTVVTRRCRECSSRAMGRNPHARRGVPSRPHPRDDIDEVVVLRLTSGRRDVRSNIGERLEATRQLLAHRLTRRQVAERIGVSARTVQRYQRELAAA